MFFNYGYFKDIDVLGNEAKQVPIQTLLTIPRAICQANDMRSAGENDSQSSLHFSSVLLAGVFPSGPDEEITTRGIAHSSTPGPPPDASPACSSSASVLLWTSPPA